MNRFLALLAIIALGVTVAHTQNVQTPPVVYSQGSWTPVLAPTTSGSWTQSVNALGTYEQVGRSITVRFFVSTTGSSTPVGNIQITGLPFTSANVANDNAVCFIGYQVGMTNSASFTMFSGLIVSNTAVIGIYETGSGQTVQVAAVARAAASTTLIGSCTYHI